LRRFVVFSARTGLIGKVGFPPPSRNDRSLRIAVVHWVVFAQRRSQAITEGQARD
jgi:hypothetical protein